MATDQRQRWCPTCHRHTLHVRHRTSEGWGCLLTVLTMGLWLPVWLLMSLCSTFTGYRCQTCGRRN